MVRNELRTLQHDQQITTLVPFKIAALGHFRTIAAKLNHFLLIAAVFERNLRAFFKPQWS